MTTVDRTAAALLRAIVAHPEEDTPRLMYADWLEENARTRRVTCPECRGLHPKKCPKCKGKKRVNVYKGAAWHRHMMTCRACEGTGAGPECSTCGATGSVVDRGDAERAEFIRVQVELARTPWTTPACPHCGCDDGYNHNTGCLYSRESSLLEAHPEWSAAPCPECGGQSVRAGTPHCPACNNWGDLLSDVRALPKAPSRILGWRRGWPVVGAALGEWGAEVVEYPDKTAYREERDSRRIWQPTPLASLVAALPGVELRATDREAAKGDWIYEQEMTGGAIRDNWVYWFDAGASDIPEPNPSWNHFAPRPIYKLLRGGRKFVNGMYYPTPELADAALGRAVWTLSVGAE